MVRASLWARRSGVRPITRFDASEFRSQVAAELPDFYPEEYLDKKQVRRFDRYSQLAVAAARLALEDAGTTPEAYPFERTGVCVGSALGGVGFGEEIL